MTELRLITDELEEGPFSTGTPLPRRLPPGRHGIPANLVIEHQRRRRAGEPVVLLAPDRLGVGHGRAILGHLLRQVLVVAEREVQRAEPELAHIGRRVRVRAGREHRRVRLLNRLRIGKHGPELDKHSVIFGPFLRPDYPHGFDALLHQLMPRGEDRSVVAHLFFVPAIADAKQETPA